MEEQRQRYGPPLYSLTKMVLYIRLFLSLSWCRYESIKLWDLLKSLYTISLFLPELMVIRFFFNFYLFIFLTSQMEQAKKSDISLGRSSWHLYLWIGKIFGIYWVLFYSQALYYWSTLCHFELWITYDDDIVWQIKIIVHLVNSAHCILFS